MRANSPAGGTCASLDDCSSHFTRACEFMTSGGNEGQELTGCAPKLQVGRLSGRIQLVQFEKLTQNGIVALGHAFHCSEIERGAFMQEEHAVSQFVREAHVMRHDDARQLELEFEFHNEITE